jgi:hypothetical protein
MTNPSNIMSLSLSINVLCVYLAIYMPTYLPAFLNPSTQFLEYVGVVHHHKS